MRSNVEPKKGAIWAAHAYQCRDKGDSTPFPRPQAPTTRPLQVLAADTTGKLGSIVSRLLLAGPLALIKTQGICVLSSFDLAIHKAVITRAIVVNRETLSALATCIRQCNTRFPRPEIRNSHLIIATTC